MRMWASEGQGWGMTCDLPSPGSRRAVQGELIWLLGLGNVFSELRVQSLRGEDKEDPR